MSRAAEIARLRREAGKLREQSDAALEAGDAKAAVLALERAMLREEMISLLESEEGLPRRDHSGTNDRMHTPASRARISAGRSRQARGETEPDDLIAKATASGHTLRSLSEAIKTETGRETPHSILSRARAGTRRIRLSAARVIERLTGFKATPRNWPGGWASDDE